MGGRRRAAVLLLDELVDEPGWPGSSGRSGADCRDPDVSSGLCRKTDARSASSRHAVCGLLPTDALASRRSCSHQSASRQGEREMRRIGIAKGDNAHGRFQDLFRESSPARGGRRDSGVGPWVEAESGSSPASPCRLPARRAARSYCPGDAGRARLELRSGRQGHDRGRLGQRLRQRARAAAGRKARRGRQQLRQRQRIRLHARPLQAGRLARHELQRDRQGHDRDRRRGRLRRRARAAAGRQAGRRRHQLQRLQQRLRARPLQPGRLARHELQRDRQGDDRDRLGRTTSPTRSRCSRTGSWSSPAGATTAPITTSRSPATTRTARSTRASTGPAR